MLVLRYHAIGFDEVGVAGCEVRGMNLQVMPIGFLSRRELPDLPTFPWYPAAAAGEDRAGMCERKQEWCSVKRVGPISTSSGMPFRL